MRTIDSTPRRWLPICLAVSAPLPAQAATGLSSLAFFSWIAWFFVALAAAGLVALAVFAARMMSRTQARQGQPSKRLGPVLVALTVLATPAFLLAFSLSELKPAWLFAVLLYVTLLAAAIVEYSGKWKFALGTAGLLIVLYIVRTSGAIALTEYIVVDNRPFAPTHLLLERHGTKFLRTDDGALYRLVDATLPQAGVLPAGSRMLVATSTSPAGEGGFRLHALIQSNEYRQYRSEFVEATITIPLETRRIERYVAYNIGRAERLDGKPWRAENRQVLHAILENCCNVEWLRTLLTHGADPVGVRVGERNLLHLLAAISARPDGIADFAAELIGAGVDINARQTQGHTPLFIAIDKLGGKHLDDPQSARNHADLVRRLLDSGADPDIASRYSETPLHRAIVRQQYEVAGLLLRHGADPRIEAHNGKTAYGDTVRALERSKDPAQRAALQALIEAM